MAMGDNDNLRLFHTGEHACGYWPERVARDLVFDPHDRRLSTVYPQALQWGFRRSGDILYRPHCASCSACVAVRIPVDAFRPTRSQRRTLLRNADVVARVLPAERNDERLALYRRYLAWRHPGGGMDTHGASEFDQFLVGQWADSRFLELRRDGRLLAVAVTDLAPDAMSAVYTFYDPDQAQHGPGTLAILRQLEWAARERRRHLYLGYWISGHDKMDYKRRFQPLEGFDGRRWRPLDTMKTR
jgi:leucyl-tRNA---protein transferase